MAIFLKRIYDAAKPTDGYRVLVDRLWPRGLTKDRARIDEWAKEVAPSNELRKWFHADRTKWPEFNSKYLVELQSQNERLEALAVEARKGNVTLLFASNDLEKNHATVLAEYLKRLLKT